jgi:asparagine synthase (glutamine-hydrolysing)
MCGIAGLVAFDLPEEELRRQAAELSARVAHRGPDDEAVWSEPGVALAHRRLAILDLSERGRQPMESSDGRWVVSCNGEIYNFRELRNELPGPWRTETDTEVLLRLLEAQGLDGIARAAGMFAFAAWDRRDRRLHLVRDRIGIKPLYYTQSGDRVTFASEPQALAALNPELRRLDRLSLSDYLVRGYPPVRRTLFEGIEAVLPAEIVTCGGGAPTRRQWWRLPETVDARMGKREALEEFSALWPRVSREHLVSDVPVGVFLSSGLDSSSIAIAVAGASPAPRAFTASFPGTSLDETDDAAALAKAAGLAHVALPVTLEDAAALLPELARHGDLPLSDSSMVGTWLLARAAASEVKVALSGDGADEVFAGYPTHRATQALASPAAPFLRFASWLLGPDVKAMPASDDRPDRSQGMHRFLRHARYGLAAHSRWRTLIDPEDAKSLLREPPVSLDDAPDGWSGPNGGQPLGNRMLAWDLTTSLVQDELVRADRMTMAHGLELRVPFLDHRLVELAFRMPYEVKGGLTGGKRVLKAWLARSGYAHVARRPKRGFHHPVARWLQGPLGDRLDDRLASSALAALLRPSVPRGWLAAHRAGREDRSFELWTLLVLLEWSAVHGVSA